MNKKIYYFIILGIILTISTIIFIQLPFVTIILDRFLGINLTLGAKIIIYTFSITLSFTFLLSFLDGKMQTLGYYIKTVSSSFFAFLGLVLFLSIGFIFQNILLIIIGLSVFNLIKIIFFLYYLYFQD
jgi:hypothetical protein